jgi:hypothetical protein
MTYADNFGRQGFALASLLLCFSTWVSDRSREGLRTKTEKQAKEYVEKKNFDFGKGIRKNKRKIMRHFEQ